VPTIIKELREEERNGNISSCQYIESDELYKNIFDSQLDAINNSIGF
jgi:hypothetical protein